MTKSIFSKGEQVSVLTTQPINNGMLDYFALRNGLRIGDLEEDDWTKKYENLKNKHLDLIKNFNVHIDFDIEELSNNFFDSIEYIKDIKFIDSEHFFNESLKMEKKLLRKELKDHYWI